MPIPTLSYGYIYIYIHIDKFSSSSSLTNDDCPEDKREEYIALSAVLPSGLNYLNCSVLQCYWSFVP